MFTDTSYESVVEYLSPFERLTVHKGEFATVVPHLPEQHYRLVHLDVDIYEPTLDCLRYFGPRLVPGGVSSSTTTTSASCPGIRRRRRPTSPRSCEFQSWNTRTKQLVIVRRAPQS